MDGNGGEIDSVCLIFTSCIFVRTKQQKVESKDIIENTLEAARNKSDHEIESKV